MGTIGPYAKKVGFDSVAQAMSGNMIMSGSPGEPAKSFGPYVDYGTAGLCAFGTMAAIMHRNATGEGQEVQGALLATALMTTNSIMSEEHVTCRGRVPTGNRGQVSAPSDLFKTKDGYIYVICAGQPMFERWARLMGDNHWLTEDRFETDDGRAENGAEISARMQKWCDEKTTKEAMDILEEHRIPVGPVYNLEQALEDHRVRHIRHLEFVEADHACLLRNLVRDRGEGILALQLLQLEELLDAIDDFDLPLPDQLSDIASTEVAHSSKRDPIRGRAAG